jgi:hypothetical protein
VRSWAKPSAQGTACYTRAVLDSTQSVAHRVRLAIITSALPGADASLYKPHPKRFERLSVGKVANAVRRGATAGLPRLRIVLT